MYALRGGLGVFDPPPIPNYLDPGYPPDPGIVAKNNQMNADYERGVQVAQASNNYDQCAANAQYANSQAQYDQVMAACRGEAAQQVAPEAGDLPVTYYTPGQPLSYTPGGPAVPTPVYQVPQFAANPPAFNPPVQQITQTSPVIPAASSSPALPASTLPYRLPPAESVNPAVVGTGASTMFGFDLSAVPLWGWAVGAGALWFMFSGNGGRR